MNFRAVATEIMLHANEEKWYETRDKIERALRLMWVAGFDVGDRSDLGNAELALHSTFYEAHACELWRDQPDGVR